MKKEMSIFDVRRLLIENYCKNFGSDLSGELEHRTMLVHKNKSMTTFGTLGYLFFALKGSPPKGYAVFKLGSPYNSQTGIARGSLNINGKKEISGITITGLDEIEETLAELLQTDTEIAKHLRKGADFLASQNIPATLELRHGVAVEEIVIESERGDFDLLVVGASASSTGLRSWLLGNVTSKLIHQSNIPILVVQKKN